MLYAYNYKLKYYKYYKNIIKTTYSPFHILFATFKLTLSYTYHHTNNIIRV